MAKKRRTELDIDSELLADKSEEASPKITEPAAPPPPKPAEEKRPRKKINKLKLLIVIASGAAATTLTVALVWLAVSLFSSVTVKHEAPPPATPKPKQEAKPALDIAPVYPLQPFFIPLKEKGSTEGRLAKIQFDIEMVSPETQRDMDRNIILVRENIYFMLQNKTAADFMDKEKLGRLTVDVAIAVNRSLQSGGVSRVFVTDLLIN